MKFYCLLVVWSMLCSYTESYAQDKTDVKFGKVKASDFNATSYAIDSSANAVIIADIGATEIVGNTKGWFSIEHKMYRRVHVLNKNGYDIADVSIPLYTNGSMEEELKNLKAVTYNLEGGKVVETKLDIKTGVFKDKINKNVAVRKFTLPNVKEGSIIEYEYKLISDFLFNLQPWSFQGKYPRLWSEYTVEIPEFLNYVSLKQGYVAPHIQTQVSKPRNFTVSDNSSVSGSSRNTITAHVAINRWVLKDVPELKMENFTSTLDNHIERIEFQLSEMRHPLTYRNIMSSWAQATKELLESEDFGLQLKKDNNWLSDPVKEATNGVIDEGAKAAAIYKYVQNQITCTNRSRKYLEQPLRDVLRKKNGNVAEVNMLLTAMLIKAGFQADPVLLSTRSNGYGNALYPLLDRYNYVITHLLLNGKSVYLDASDPNLGFGRLGYECYNGPARLIGGIAGAEVILDPSTLTESEMTIVGLEKGDDGELTGTYSKRLGYYGSMSLRKKYKEKGVDGLIEEYQSGFGVGESRIENLTVDSLLLLEEPATVKVNMKLKAKEDLIYMNPLFGELYKENPFKSQERFYPVEMPYTINQVFMLRCAIPEGYEIDEKPKSMRLRLNEDGDGAFEYAVEEKEGYLSIRNQLVLKRTYFSNEEYAMLREFFNLVIKKQAEQVVFKKKK